MSALSIMVKPVSGACNMHCAYCFYSDVMSHRKTHVYPHMSEQTLEILVQRVFRYADNQVSFFFQGGEPTLAGLPFFEALIRFEQIYNVRNLPVFNAVQTNAYALSDEMISFFARENFLLGVSLDGDRFAHDHLRLDQSGLPTFDRVCTNLNRLTHAGVEFNILCVVNKYVAQRARDVFENLAPYRYLQFIACLDDFDGHKTNYSLTEQSYLHFLKTCFDLYFEAFQAGRPVSIRCFDNYLSILLGLPPESCAMFGECGQYLLIEADGSVYPCDFYVLDKSSCQFRKKTTLYRRITFCSGSMQTLPLVSLMPQRLQTRTQSANWLKSLVRLLSGILYLCIFSIGGNGQSNTRKVLNL